MTSTSAPAHRPTIDRAACPSSVAAPRRAVALLGAAAVVVAVAVIWSARLQVARTVYVSQLGATGAETAAVFNAALLLLGLGGLLAGLSGSGLRARVRGLAAWSVGASLMTSGAAFVVASRVTCTAGCPVPFTPGSTVQDLVHVTVAVIGFASAGWAMLQAGWGAGTRPLQLVSRIAAVAVAAAASAGGLLSVLQLRTDVGAMLEFVAMTVAAAWLALFAASRAVRAGG